MNDTDSLKFLTVGPDDQLLGNRLDSYIAHKLSNSFSRHRVKQLIVSGNIRVNGDAVKANYRVQSSDKIEIRIPAPVSAGLEPWDHSLDIIYEDDHLLVVNKPAGIPVHPSPGHDAHTLVHALLHHCRTLSGIGGVERPGIVHRLDKNTSGLLMVAKTDQAHRNLSRQLKDRTILREYHALVLGKPVNDEGTIDFPIGRHPRHRKKMSVRSHKARTAVTQYRLLEVFDEISLVSIRLLTGRTHQIRVHFSSIHHPVLGDDTYSAQSLRQIGDTELRSMIKQLPAYALHARTLGFVHPVTGESLNFESPVPEYFDRILHYVRREHS